MKECIHKWLTEQIGGEDPQLLNSLYEEYRSTVKVQVAQMCKDIAAADFAQLNRTAHSLKGTTLTVGDEELLREVLDLRDAAKASDLAGATAAAKRVQELCEQL